MGRYVPRVGPSDYRYVRWTITEGILAIWIDPMVNLGPHRSIDPESGSWIENEVAARLDLQVDSRTGWQLSSTTT